MIAAKVSSAYLDLLPIGQADRFTGRVWTVKMRNDYLITEKRDLRKESQHLFRFRTGPPYVILMQ